MFNLYGGSTYKYHFTAPIARECPHHLLSVSKMSAENVCGLTMERGPYGACFLGLVEVAAQLIFHLLYLPDRA